MEQEIFLKTMYNNDWLFWYMTSDYYFFLVTGPLICLGDALGIQTLLIICMHFTLLWQWSKILPGFVRPKASIIIDLLGNSPIASVAWRSLCSPSGPGFYHSWLWAGRWGPSLSCRRCRFSASCMEDNLSSIFLLWGWKLCLTLSVP